MSANFAKYRRVEVETDSGNLRGLSFARYQPLNSTNWLPLQLARYNQNQSGAVGMSRNLCVPNYGVQPVVPYPLLNIWGLLTSTPQRRKRPLTEFWKTEVLNSERRVEIKKSKATSKKVHNRLKRLQRRVTMTSEVVSRCKAERLEKKVARKEMQISRGRRTESPVECSLWNCPRPRGHRRARLPSFASGGSRRCRSRLSDLSRRSRTPIVLRPSPLLDANGFQIKD